MKLFAVVLALIGLLSATATADVGSCYSPKPICLSGQPVCLCTYTMQCWWGCK